MDNNNYGQDYGQDYGYDYGNDPGAPKNKSIKGYQIIIIVLAVILGALSFLYYNQMNTLKQEYAIERDTLTNRLMSLRDDYDDLRTENDTIAANLEIEKLRADSLLQSLQKERSWSRQKIKQYESELGTLRAVMQTHVKTIDSLNTLNERLIKENLGYRSQVSTQARRIAAAEEKAEELSTKIRKGQVILARDISMTANSKSDKEVAKASRAAYLSVNFVLSANELADHGTRSIYVRITGPEGYILANSNGAVFNYEGENLTYSAMREVEYVGRDFPVRIYYDGGGITSGKYSVQIYMDGFLIGSTEVMLK